jgi:hypothetical protein
MASRVVGLLMRAAACYIKPGRDPSSSIQASKQQQQQQLAVFLSQCIVHVCGEKEIVKANGRRERVQLWVLNKGHIQ